MAECGLCDARTEEWSRKDYHRPHWGKQFDRTLQDNWELPVAVVSDLLGEMAEHNAPIEKRFYALADNWSNSTGHISSVSDLTSHPSYREIIKLGWEVVPFLLIDLQKNKRFWFPALYAITNVRPFDPSDAGNGRRMTDAWLKWGKRKGLI